MEIISTSLSKKQRLGEIRNEVKDFHPLLEKILIELPRVKRSDYTHGSTERGADFVLTREDDTVNDVEHVGIIAKIGKITKDLNDIYNQIDDCDLSRYTLNGKKNIRLDEIWIITNETVSVNAQEKIYEKFSSRKIKFIDSKILIKWIDKYIPNYWNDVSINIGQYFYELQSFMSELDKTHSLLPSNIEPFYVDQDLRAIENQYKIDKTKSKNKNCDIYELIEKNRIVVIEGGPGSGKSQMIRNSVKNFCNPSVYINKKIVPIYLSYQDYCKEYKEKIANVISKKLGKCENELCKNCTYLIFIDGFDESVDKNRYIDDEMTSLINELSSNANVNAVITTRPLNIVDYRKLLPGRIPGYEIIPLGIEKVNEFFKHICKNATISGKIFNDISKSDLFKQLPKSPISAILLAFLLNENSRDLPSNLTDIYSQYSELMLGRWEISKGLRSQKEYEASSNILTYISKYFVENDLSCISINETIIHFSKYLNVRNLDLDPEDLFHKITTRSGILQRDDKRNIVYFKHRSFMEFFYATYKAKHPDSEFINTRVYSVPWRTIYFFYVGIHKDCEEILIKILNTEPTNENERFFRILNMADYFLAAYSTPYDIVERNLPKLIIEYSELYFDIIENKIDTPFNELSEIMILEFFQHIIKSSYSYDFFSKGFESAIVDICSEYDHDTNKLLHSLFFISVIYRAMNKDNPFDGLLEKYKGKIPLSIQFGLYYESIYVKHHSSLLKRNERNLLQKLKKSKELRMLAEKLHDNPVSRIKSLEDKDKDKQ